MHKGKSIDEYAVGFSKPPSHSRFHKGQSGNPNGRPKGTVNLSTVFLKTLREKVVVNENGQRTTITKLEAAMKQLVNKSATGDLRALSLFWQITLVAERAELDDIAPKEVLNEVDQKVMRGILKRYQYTLKGGKADD